MTGPRKLPASLSPCLQAPVQAQPGAMGGSDGDPPEERQGASTKEPLRGPGASEGHAPGGRDRVR